MENSKALALSAAFGAVSALGLQSAMPWDQHARAAVVQEMAETPTIVAVIPAEKGAPDDKVRGLWVVLSNRRVNFCKIKDYADEKVVAARIGTNSCTSVGTAQQ